MNSVSVGGKGWTVQQKNKNIFCALKQHAESFKLVEENLH